MKPKIVCAALKFKNEEVIIGVRHFDKFMQDSIKKRRYLKAFGEPEEGFVDQYGKFYNTEQALILAHDNNQIMNVGIKHDEENRLYSENLY